MVKEAKYLGIIIDNKLTFGPHIAHPEVKLSRSVGILSKLKYCLPSPLLLKLYHALFHSYFLYMVHIMWFNTYKTYTNKITAPQNKAVKLISNSKRNDKCSPTYNNLEILQIQDLHFFFLKLLCLPLNFIARNSLDLFHNTSLEPPKFILNTRSNTSGLKHYIPRFKTERLQRSIRYVKAKIWNRIPIPLKKTITTNSLSNCRRTYITIKFSSLYFSHPRLLLTSN